MLKIDQFIDENRKTINDKLAQIFIVDDSLPQHELYEAANYALHPGGKRLRPLLTLATIETMKKNVQDGVDVACAIELVHTYSLVHDDLPCMDDDDLRRGKPSLHKAFSESTALLTGDFLLTYAFELISNSPNLSDIKKNKIVDIVAKSSGSQGMIGGQFIDLDSEGKKIDWESLKNIHINKTASLITCALHCGGIIADANEKEIRSLIRFGQCIGLAYQIVDDILDISSDEEVLGKPACSDVKKEKATAITVLGLEKAKQSVNDLYENSIFHLSGLSFPPPLLKDMAHKLIKRAK